MPTNQFFSKHPRQEQLLLEDMLDECIKIHGEDVFYLPRQFQRLDPVFGEDVLSKFTLALPIELYIESFSGYGGEEKILSKFGLQINDQLNVTISKRSFNYSVGKYGEGFFTNTRPQEGDLIYIPMTEKLFEIRFVADDNAPFYQIGNKYLFQLTLEAFQYNSEEIETGFDAIDMIGERNSVDRLSFSILLEDGSVLLTETGGHFIREVYQNDIRETYEDQPAIEKQQVDLNVMDFSEDDPFNETFN